MMKISYRRHENGKEWFKRELQRHGSIETRTARDKAAERQMSHMERNSVRAAYIHKAEHLEERRLMLQWWADFLDANREKGISPFEYAKINNPLK